MPATKSHFYVALVTVMTISPSKPTLAFTARPICQSLHSSSLLYVSTPRSPSQPRSQSPTPPSKNRNRGANAANHNRRGHEFRLNKKRQGGRGGGAGRNSKRAPRWEREGDALYAEVSKRVGGIAASGEGGEGDGSSQCFERTKSDPIGSVRDVHEALRPWMLDDSAIDGKRASVARNEKSASERREPTAERTKKPPPFLWGALPVGPVLSSRLLASGRPSPTPVQKAAFSVLTAPAGRGTRARSNAVIASPTGTGKTLAYLLPLLCTSPGGQHGEGTGGVLVVTPTIELACQIRREVDALWPPREGGRSAVFVAGDGPSVGEEEGDATPGRRMLRSIPPNSPFVAGTPKMLRALYREAERIARSRADGTVLDGERVASESLLSNMRAIVLDEADRLLRTEAAAREAAERKERKVALRSAEATEEDGPSRKKRLIIARQTQTELLLRDLPVPSLEHVQIICASATVGRTMRRQLMQILDAPSVDAAAALITGEDDARVKSKDSERRKSVLLPEKLLHSYRVVDVGDVSEVGVEMSEMSVAQRNEEMVIRSTVKSLWDTMTTSIEEAKPVLIFPGKIGVERIQQELLSRGLKDVRTLRNLDGTSPECDAPLDDVTTESRAWESVPVYIIGERFARGLDLPDVEYVFILTPPSSAAGYAHMAGRTGRSGKRGRAVTFVRPKNNEVKRLIAIADTLGVKFCPMSERSSEII